MLDVKTAIALAMQAYPNKRMYGEPGEWKDQFTFRFVEKTATEDEAKWDATVIAVDKQSGNVTMFNAFSNYDFIANAKLIHEY